MLYFSLRASLVSARICTLSLTHAASELVVLGEIIETELYMVYIFYCSSPVDVCYTAERMRHLHLIHAVPVLNIFERSFIYFELYSTFSGSY